MRDKIIVNPDLADLKQACDRFLSTQLSGLDAKVAGADSVTQEAQRAMDLGSPISASAEIKRLLGPSSESGDN